MKGTSGVHKALYFEDFELDLDRCMLLRGGVELQIRRQSFEVLRYLVEKSGQLVAKEELLSEVWAGRAVTDDSITQCLMEIRVALGDKDHTRVKTLPRRGYLFDPPVSESEPASKSATVHGSLISGRKPVIALVAAGFALVLTLSYLVWRSGLSPPTRELSIAVLPFENRSNREEDQFFTDGMHDELLSTIARVGSLKVISRTSVNEYRDTVKKIPQIAQELGVTNILEGGVQRSGNQVRINVQLIDAAADDHLWTETYDRELTAENLFAVQSEITKMIADALQANLSIKEQQRIDARPTDNLQAYNAYMRGRQLIATRDTSRLKLATEEFDKATRLDPLFALAWVGVADSNRYLSGRGSYRTEDLISIREEALKNAFAIDGELGEAHASLATIHFYYGRHDEAEIAYQKAIELSPNYASAYHGYSRLLSAYPLRMQKQVDLARKAVELDPRSSVFLSNLGRKYRDQGLYPLAEGQFQKVIELNPDFAPGYYDLAFLYMFEMSRFDKALPMVQKARELDPENHFQSMLLIFIYKQLDDLEAIQDVREELARLGAEEWLLGLVDVLISYGNENPADTLDVIRRLLPEVQHSRYWVRLLGYFALTLGDTQYSREIFLSLEPGWLTPDKWPALIERTRNYGCIVAWVLINTGDQDIGAALLEQATNYIEDSLPLVTSHPDRYLPDGCYLVAGETEKALQSIETQLAHNHLYAWNAEHRMAMYDQIRDNPRFQAAQVERERRISVQRETIKNMITESHP